MDRHVISAVCVSVLQKPGTDLADAYITFVRQNQDILRERVSDELHVEKLFDVSDVWDVNPRSERLPAGGAGSQGAGEERASPRDKQR